jgi:hypothetical protein
MLTRAVRGCEGGAWILYQFHHDRAHYVRPAMTTAIQHAHNPARTVSDDDIALAAWGRGCKRTDERGQRAGGVVGGQGEAGGLGARWRCAPDPPPTWLSRSSSSNSSVRTRCRHGVTVTTIADEGPAGAVRMHVRRRQELDEG